MVSSPLEALQAWYKCQCDGDWEHHYGITVETLDNPGWWVKIDLTGTPLAGKTFEEIAHNTEHPMEWYVCRVVDNRFDGAGGPRMLNNILQCFIEWADSSLIRDKK